MLIRKLVACAAAASLFYWAPSVIPVKRTQVAIAGCGVILTSLDVAYAAPIPCPVTQGGGTANPAAVIGMVAGTLSIMINAAIVWSTQCRELTLGEAMTAMALPGVGIAMNQANGARNMCPGH